MHKLVAILLVMILTLIPAEAMAHSKRKVVRRKRTKIVKVSDQSRANTILNQLTARHPELKGTTIEFGSTPNNYQAVCYYTVGRIIVNPKHKATIDRIINHELGHVLDYRDNGVINWGENIPKL
jgi:hypothetical protein